MASLISPIEDNLHNKGHQYKGDREKRGQTFTWSVQRGA